MIIQLDEVAPPPPPSKAAPLSPGPSSSQSYDYYSSSEECEEIEEEEATESYCSSDPSCPELGMGDPECEPAMTLAPVEQKAKMSRVLAWRNSFDSVFTEDNAGMSRLCLLPYPWYFPTVSCHSPRPHVRRLRLRSAGFSRIRLSVTLARAIASVLFFSRSLLSLAALMSLKRKYSHEPEDGENGEVGSQPELGESSDAVSPPFPTVFVPFPPSTLLSRLADYEILLSLSRESLEAIFNPFSYLACCHV